MRVYYRKTEVNEQFSYFVTDARVPIEHALHEQSYHLGSIDGETVLRHGAGEKG